jgi:hypothetical protein
LLLLHCPGQGSYQSLQQLAEEAGSLGGVARGKEAAAAAAAAAAVCWLDLCMDPSHSGGVLLLFVPISI